MDIGLVILGAAALLLRAGFGLYASGSLRAKNGASAVLRITADTAVSALVFWAVGAAILFQTNNGYFGLDFHYLPGQSPPFADSEFFHLTIILIAGAIVAGAIAERTRFYVGVVLSILLAGLIVPIAGHWAWTGWLKEHGFIDTGGAAVIHLSAAACAAVAALFVGPRVGKYNKDGTSNSIPGHALPLSSVGVLLLLAGWFPYLLGCVISHGPVSEATGEPMVAVAAMNIILAASAGALAGLIYGQFRYGKPDVFFTYTGLLAALVAISAGVTTMGNLGAVITGAIAGLVVPLLTLEVDRQGKLDDPLGVISIHGIGGIWGTFAAALFAPADFHHRLNLLGIQTVGIVAILILSVVLSLAVVLLLKLAGSLRCTDADEQDGLDIGEHDINGYPDFQQTTIKSYHLREA
jgi:ammonium transporter, Amt family